ncbi:MAG: quinol:electron acceptor oxidoreductase subunit ActD [Armatimonadota bacterium]|jgi:hypothetical protein
MARVRGVFDDWQATKNALQILKDTRTTGYTAYAPVDLKEVEDLMPSKSSFVRGWATFGAALGLATFFLMCVFTSMIYNLIVGGKPPVSRVPYVVPTYEGTLLIGAVLGFLAGILYAKLGAGSIGPDYDVRFSGDCFGVEITCTTAERESMIELLKNAGAVEVYEP